ncbi:Pentapeptide repeats (8 copies) [compost metagenome]
MGVLKPWFYELWQSKQLFAFQTYVVHAIRYAVLQLDELPSFQALELGEEFEIIVGEYGDALLGESVYYCNVNQRTEKSVHNWLHALIPHGYVHEHLENLDLSGVNYGGINMNYSRLQQVNLTSAQWSYASLIGSRFQRCEAAGVDFTGSVLFDADFAHSVLTEAKFDEVIAPLDSVNEEDAVFFGIYPISFIHADLTNASFQDACIAADFRGAILDGVNFQGADLTGSLMLREDEMRVNLTLEQRETIKWG